MYFSEGICSARCSDAIKVQYRMQNHKKGQSAEERSAREFVGHENEHDRNKPE
jgi:hypothetical protein